MREAMVVRGEQDRRTSWRVVQGLGEAVGVELVRCRRVVAVRDDVALWLGQERRMVEEEEQGERSL